MPFFARRSRSAACFYCGITSPLSSSANHHPNGRVRHFTCPQCSADNHLDPAGEIVDYTPSPQAAPALQFAHKAAAATAAPTNSDEVTFCRTCLKNQSIIYNSLANYILPSEDDPEYAHHVSVRVPLYCAQLEDKWPPVCPNCAPKVNARINRSNYYVKTAVLGQGLARTSATRASPMRKSPRGRWLKAATWYARGTVWCLTHVLMLAWHGSVVLHPEGAVGGQETDWKGCIMRSFAKKDIDAACANVTANWVGRYAPLSILGFFWVYREREKERHPERRLVGGKEYLRLEISVLALRMFSWWLLAPGGPLEFMAAALARIHMAMFVVSLVASLFSITCLKLEEPARLNLRETQPISYSPVSSQPPSPRPQLPLLSRQTSTTASQRSPSHPTTPPRLRRRTALSSTTPMPCDQRPPASFSPGGDAMDWDPTTPTTQQDVDVWRPRNFTGPSPFVGVLPPAPRTNIFSVNQPQVAAPSATAPVRQQFFAHRQRQTGTASTPPKGSEWNKLTDPTHRLTSPKYAPFKPPRFQMPIETTGLEAMLGPGLRLDAEPETATLAEPDVAAEVSSLGEAAARAALVILAGVLAWSELPHSGTLGAIVLVLAAMWVSAKNGGLVRIAAVAGALAATAAGVAIRVAHWKLLGVIRTLVLLAGMSEVWAALMRGQRARTRAFWEEERKSMQSPPPPSAPELVQKKAGSAPLLSSAGQLKGAIVAGREPAGSSSGFSGLSL